MSYAIVRMDTLEVVQAYPDMPPFIAWPNGDQSHPATIGDERDRCRFVSVVYEPDAPNEFCQIENITPSLSGNLLVYTRTWVANDLADIQSALNVRLDAVAESQRAKYITLGSGQAMIYMEKLAEARAFSADKAPDPANYPLLAATIGPDGSDLASVAAMVIKTSALWTQAGAKIEGIRRKAKAAINAAQNVDDAVKAFSTVQW